MDALLFAQEVVNPSGPMGWLTLAVQGGSFGLIAYFVIRILPQAIEALREDRKEIVKAFKEEVETVRTRADARTDRMTSRLEVSINTLRDDLKENTKATRDLSAATTDNTHTMKTNGH